MFLRRAFIWLALTVFTSLAVGAAGCQPPSETTRDSGRIDASGHALIRASAPGDNHHWSIDITLRSAPEGTYALLFSTTEPDPADRTWFAIAADDPALRCAAARARGCTLTEYGRDGEVVGIATVGPGGTGVLRATFDVGTGGWFRLMRIEERDASSAPFDIRIVSEALTKDEQPYRFAIEQMH